MDVCDENKEKNDSPLKIIWWIAEVSKVTNERYANRSQQRWKQGFCIE